MQKENKKNFNIVGLRRCCLIEAGGRQGRLVSYRKANKPLVKLMNLAWGL